MPSAEPRWYVILNENDEIVTGGTERATPALYRRLPVSDLREKLEALAKEIGHACDQYHGVPPWVAQGWADRIRALAAADLLSEEGEPVTYAIYRRSFGEWHYSHTIDNPPREPVGEHIRYVPLFRSQEAPDER